MATSSTAITYTTALAYSSKTITFQDTSSNYGTFTISAISSDEATIGTHTFSTGDPVLYEDNGGSVSGLTDGTTYYAIRISSTKIKFATTEANANAGTSISISSLSGSPQVKAIDLTWAEASNAILAKITSPDGVVDYNNTNGSSPDATGVDASFTTNLPVDGDGNVKQGRYTVRLTYFDVTDTGLSNAFYRDYEFEVSYASPVHDIDISHSVINPVFFKSVDNTVYDKNAVTPTITRDHRLYYPSAIGGFNQVTTKTLNTNLFYTGVSEVYLKSTLTYTFTSGNYSDASGTPVNFSVTDIITSRVDYTVSGVTSTCDFYCAMKEVYNNYYTYKTTDVGRANGYWAQYQEANFAWQMLDESINCGKSVDMQTYVNRLNIILGDACGCSDSTTSVQVVGIGTVTNIDRVYNHTDASPLTVYTFTIADGATTTSTATTAALVGLTFDKDFMVTADGGKVTGGSFNSVTGAYTFPFTVTAGTELSAIIIKP
jgi:hypothetical protein